MGIARRAQDDWAISSHIKALGGGFTREFVGLAGVSHDTFARVLTAQTAGRATVLASSVTTATTAVAADAAAFVVVVSQAWAGKTALRIAGGATRGAAPDEPGLAPVTAMTEVLQRAGLTAQDLQMAEIMEAYAVQALACIHAMGIDPAIVNPAGGALARGHPIGASGAILAVRLFHGLAAGYGLAAIAAAGGIGTALLVER